jgi:hypothetical protein
MLLKKVLLIPENGLTILPLELTPPEKVCPRLNKVRPLLHKVLPSPQEVVPTPEKGEPLLEKGVSFRVSGYFGMVAGMENRVADKNKVVASNLYDDFGGFMKKSGAWFCCIEAEKIEP